MCSVGVSELPWWSRLVVGKGREQATSKGEHGANADRGRGEEERTLSVRNALHVSAARAASSQPMPPF